MKFCYPLSIKNFSKSRDCSLLWMKAFFRGVYYEFFEEAASENDSVAHS